MDSSVTDEELLWNIKLLIIKSSFTRFDKVYKEYLSQTRNDIDALSTHKNPIEITSSTSPPTPIENTNAFVSTSNEHTEPTNTKKIVRLKGRYLHLHQNATNSESHPVITKADSAIENNSVSEITNTPSEEDSSSKELTQKEKDDILHKSYWKTQVETINETKKKLKEKGLTLKEILTKENLTKWLVDEKLSYSVIARDYAGCPNSIVAEYAKKFGLTSVQSERKRLLKEGFKQEFKE